MRFACNGPEGTFWTDDSALANKLIAATFDRDEWTVTDTNLARGLAGIAADLASKQEPGWPVPDSIIEYDPPPHEAAAVGVAAKLASLKEEVDQLAYRVDSIPVLDAELHLVRISERLALIIEEAASE